jgi:hypothetical protein
MPKMSLLRATYRPYKSNKIYLYKGKEPPPSLPPRTHKYNGDPVESEIKHMNEKQLKQLEQKIFTAFLLDNPDIKPTQIMFEECSKIFNESIKNFTENELTSMSLCANGRIYIHTIGKQKDIFKNINNH